MSGISYIVNIDEFVERVINPLKSSFVISTMPPEGKVFTAGCLVENEVAQSFTDELMTLKYITINQVSGTDDYVVEVETKNKTFQIAVSNGRGTLENEGADFIAGYESIKIHSPVKSLVNLTFVKGGI